MGKGRHNSRIFLTHTIFSNGFGVGQAEKPPKGIGNKRAKARVELPAAPPPGVRPEAGVPAFDSDNAVSAMQSVVNVFDSVERVFASHRVKGGEVDDAFVVGSSNGPQLSNGAKRSLKLLVQSPVAEARVQPLVQPLDEVAAERYVDVKFHIILTGFQDFLLLLLLWATFRDCMKR
jgi:hypothetical protein